MIDIQHTKHRGKFLLKLGGELTIYAASEARRELTSILAKHSNLELDLSGITEIDTAGIQLLFWLKQELRRTGHDLPLIHHSAGVVEVLDLLNLTAAFGDPILISSDNS